MSMERRFLKNSWIRSSAVGTDEVGLVGHGRVPRPASRARTMASARLDTPSLVRTFDTWLRTVLRLEHERVGNLGIGHSPGHQRKDLALPLRQAREEGGRRVVARRVQ